MRFSGIIGTLLAFGILVGDISLADDIFSFIYLPAFMVCVFGTIGLSYLSFGALDTLQAFSSLRLLVVRPGPEPLSPRRAEVLRGSIIHLYACGLIATMISFLKMISYAAMKHTLIWGLSSTMVSLLPLLYSLIGAEFLLRPAVYRLHRLSEHDPDDT